MNKTKLLFIRACKTLNKKRLCSVYRRFHLNTSHINEHILMILQEICFENDLIDLRVYREIQEKLNPDNWRYNKDKSYIENSLDVHISIIAHSKVDKFEGYITPKRFRK